MNTTDHTTAATEEEPATEPAQSSLSLVVHRPVEDYQQGVLCPNCKHGNLTNCGPRLFYCTGCGSATVFQQLNAQITDTTSAIAHALVAAARSLLSERIYWVEQVDLLEARIAELQAERQTERRGEERGEGARHDHL